MKRGVFLIVLFVFTLISINSSDSLICTKTGINICKQSINPLCVNQYDFLCVDNQQKVEQIMGSGWCQCCTPNCPDPATINCGVQLTPTNGCGSCAGTGIKCPVNQNCQSGVCVTTCNPNTGALCYSSQNACGQTNTGTIQCDGTCNALTPALPSYYGQACGCGGAKDCNNNCIGGTPLLTFYLDADNDNYGSTSSTTACTQPAGYVTNNQDCNDANININPGKSENTQALCSDTLDNNCNSLADCRDSSCSGIIRTDGKKCCISPTQCTNDQTCESNVCQTPSKIGNPTCCLTYTECLAAASKNSGNTLAWPKSADCVRNGITERPECY